MGLWVAPVYGREGKSRLSNAMTDIDEDPYGYIAMREACVKCIMAQGNVPWPAVICPPCHPPTHTHKVHDAEEKKEKEPWTINSVTILMSLMTFIHACCVTIAKLVVKGGRKALKWYNGDEDKGSLEERIKKLEDRLQHQEVSTMNLPQLRNGFLAYEQRLQKLEYSHSSLQEDKKVLDERLSTIKEDLEKAKVNVEEPIKIGEGILRHRRLPGKEWSKAEIKRA
ncbi:hypothetical protein N7465_011687 [Penicillium sp. CMV-2018d]|nr:hypothetical protein N7465_011687 [Penicillium sp. CMV-2018d]